MKRVGVYEAKTQLARLLGEVERGESVTITRHGRPVARLVPLRGSGRTPAEAIRAIREFRKSHALRGLKTRDLISEGRKR
jgi:prevent-host-death family protein